MQRAAMDAGAAEGAGVAAGARAAEGAGGDGSGLLSTDDLALLVTADLCRPAVFPAGAFLVAEAAGPTAGGAIQYLRRGADGEGAAAPASNREAAIDAWIAKVRDDVREEALKQREKAAAGAAEVAAAAGAGEAGGNATAAAPGAAADSAAQIASSGPATAPPETPAEQFLRLYPAPPQPPATPASGAPAAPTPAAPGAGSARSPLPQLLPFEVGRCFLRPRVARDYRVCRGFAQLEVGLKSAHIISCEPLASGAAAGETAEDADRGLPPNLVRFTSSVVHEAHCEWEGCAAGGEAGGEAGGGGGGASGGGGSRTPGPPTLPPAGAAGDASDAGSGEPPVEGAAAAADDRKGGSVAGAAAGAGDADNAAGAAGAAVNAAGAAGFAAGAGFGAAGGVPDSGLSVRTGLLIFLTFSLDGLPLYRSRVLPLDGRRRAVWDETVKIEVHDPRSALAIDLFDKDVSVPAAVKVAPEAAAPPPPRAAAAPAAAGGGGGSGDCFVAGCGLPLSSLQPGREYICNVDFTVALEETFSLEFLRDQLRLALAADEPGPAGKAARHALKAQHRGTIQVPPTAVTPPMVVCVRFRLSFCLRCPTALAPGLWPPAAAARVFGAQVAALSLPALELSPEALEVVTSTADPQRLLQQAARLWVIFVCRAAAPAAAAARAAARSAPGAAAALAAVWLLALCPQLLPTYVFAAAAAALAAGPLLFPPLPPAAAAAGGGGGAAAPGKAGEQGNDRANLATVLDGNLPDGLILQLLRAEKTVVYWGAKIEKAYALAGRPARQKMLPLAAALLLAVGSAAWPRRAAAACRLLAAVVGLGALFTQSLPVLLLMRVILGLYRYARLYGRRRKHTSAALLPRASGAR